MMPSLELSASGGGEADEDDTSEVGTVQKSRTAAKRPRGRKRKKGEKVKEKEKAKDPKEKKPGSKKQRTRLERALVAG